MDWNEKVMEGTKKGNRDKMKYEWEKEIKLKSIRGRKQAEFMEQKVNLMTWRQVCAVLQNAEEKKKGMKLYI